MNNPDKSDKMLKITITFNQSLKDFLEELSEETGIPQSKILRRAFLNQHKEEYEKFMQNRNKED